MKYFNTLAEMIGRTPLLRLGRIAAEHAIYAKCEFMNPLSVKDRPVLQIIEDAEREGSPTARLSRRQAAIRVWRSPLSVG